MAGIIQGRSGAAIGVSPCTSATGQVSDGAAQWQPAGGRRGLQTGRQSTCTVSLQGAGARWQHSTVSTVSLINKACVDYQP